MPGVNVEQAAAHTDPVGGEVSMVFQFEHVDLDHGPGGKFDQVPLDLRRLKESLGRWQLGLADRGWNSLYWNNHDQPRAVSRFGDDGKYRVASAKTLATTLHMMKGTPYVYQGEELGMTNAGFSDIAGYRDVETLNHHRHALAAGADEESVMAGITRMSRDNARTPMQWDASPNAGFTTGTPWLAVNPNHTEINAEAALADPDSVFHHYRRLIALRKELPVVVHGVYAPLLPDHPVAAQYAVCFAYRVRYAMQLNARAAMQMIELRSTPQGHPQYRAVVQEMHRLIGEQAGHTAVADAMVHVDHGQGELERLESERAAEVRRTARAQATAGGGA
jgi:oligo-1,6-glucosidase